LGAKAYKTYLSSIERNIDSMAALIKKDHPTLIKKDYTQCKTSQLIYEQSNANSVIDLAQKGVPSLLYFGDKDFFTTWYGGYEVVSKIWQDSEEEEESLNMKMKGKQICSIRIKSGITFAKVTNAGHYVDIDAPRELHILVKDWIKKHI
jgi:carboxypeptidase C (cathepsin A)